MLQYAVLPENLSPNKEKEFSLILLKNLIETLALSVKKSIFIYKNKKIYSQGEVFFYYDEATRLFVSKHAKECKRALVNACQTAGFSAKVVDFFENLQFYASEEEALINSRNGSLYSTWPRTHKNDHIRNFLVFNGSVTSTFGIEKILSRNSGLIFTTAFNDLSFYNGLCDLLPSFKKAGVSIFYVILPCNIFLPLFKTFNKSPNMNLDPIRQELENQKKDRAFLYNKERNKAFCKLFLALKKAGIAIYPCDVSSNHFSTSASGEKTLDKRHRINIGNACMIRSIEKFQSDHGNPKFIALIGMAHTNIAEALNTPACFIGDVQEVCFSENKKSLLMKILPNPREIFLSQVDYICDTKQGMAIRMNASAIRDSFFSLKPISIDQKEDPTIKELIAHWNDLILQVPYFSSVSVDEAKKAKTIYINFSLRKQQENRSNLVNTCASLQPFFVEKLTRAIYPKSTELLHPKNWSSLFHCQRPYGIRLSEGESAAFTLANLCDETHITDNHQVKLHHA